MTDITQADRDAAAHVWTALDADQLDTTSLQIFFASHRITERARIVAWLRKEAIFSTDNVRRRMNEALDQVEAGEHMK